MKKRLSQLILVFLISMPALAQEFGISAEIRPRYEHRHGFGTLIETDQAGSHFVSQRSRINFDFAFEMIKLKFSGQHTGVWGDVGTLGKSDNNLSINEAWAQAIFSDKFSVKFGRQVISYDDQRIIGATAWAQQARRFDAMVARWQIAEKTILDVGLSLSNDGEISVGDMPYSNAAGYKAMGFGWFHHDFKNLGFSALFLNNGVEHNVYGDDNLEVDYTQTFGSHITYDLNRFSADGSIYFQTGKLNTNEVSATNYALNLRYIIAKELTINVGYEYFSGKDMNDTSNDVKSFNPLYGTNHKFNGLMDYFYVGGQHLNNVGLNDLHFGLTYKKDKFFVKVAPHFFFGAADIYDGSVKMDDNLGFEIDMTTGYNFTSDINLQGGFSMMSATESMEVIKGGGDSDEGNYWGWVMITFKPTLFKSKA
ncbi:alginate export family protein [Urechidicola sp. KH5]